MRIGLFLYVVVALGVVLGAVERHLSACDDPPPVLPMVAIGVIWPFFLPFVVMAGDIDPKCGGAD